MPFPSVSSYRLSMAAQGSNLDSAQAAATEVVIGLVGPIPGTSLRDGSLISGWFDGNMDVPTGTAGTATFRVRGLTTSTQAIATGSSVGSYGALSIVTTGAGATFEQRAEFRIEVLSIAGTLTLFPSGFIQNAWGTNATNQQGRFGVATNGVAYTATSDLYLAYSVTWSQNTNGNRYRFLSGAALVWP